MSKAEEAQAAVRRFDQTRTEGARDHGE
ncbi:MAG: hypothetical protein U0527_08255 [Candidatus Eisenbacteria bacterium]